MHTAEPRMIKDDKTKSIYGWRIGDIDTKHMQLVEDVISGIFGRNVYFLHFSLKEFIQDIEKATINYASRLKSNILLQEKYKQCEEEIRIRKVEL